MLRGLRRGVAALALANLPIGGGAAVVAANRQQTTRPGRPIPAVRPQAVAARAVSWGGAPGPVPERRVAVRWRRSTSVGLQWAGRLVDGVQVPPQGRTFFTWDPILRRAPNRAWRRWGNDRVVRTLLGVLEDYAAAHPAAARIGIGDLSRPHGGDFGVRYGWPGHVSHQNGLDVDVYFPRRDELERAPVRVSQIDRALAQDLVRRFVSAGAAHVFVGPGTGLRGPPQIVQVLAHHDNHLHTRFTSSPVRRHVLGRSVRGRAVGALAIGDPDGRERLLIVGSIHGD